LAKKLVLAAVAVLAITTGALAVSVGELVKNCGDDSKAYCEGVGYGDAMTECLVQHRAELQLQCKLIVDRIEGGEKVSLF
jgi:hypothetical protein